MLRRLHAKVHFCLWEEGAAALLSFLSIAILWANVVVTE